MKEYIQSTVKKLCRQERDWTCSVACLRTLMSVSKELDSEETLVTKGNLVVGPQSSMDLLEAGILPKDSIVPGSGERNGEFLWSLLRTCNVMIECSISYAHWLVIMAAWENDNGDKYIQMYDPFYDYIRIENWDSVIEMWYDISGLKVDQDFIALPKE